MIDWAVAPVVSVAMLTGGQSHWGLLFIAPRQ